MTYKVLEGPRGPNDGFFWLKAINKSGSVIWITSFLEMADEMSALGYSDFIVEDGVLYISISWGGSDGIRAYRILYPD